MTDRKLNTDANGEVILFPISGWEIRSVASIAVMLVADYLEKPEQLGTDQAKSIQFALMPQQALELAEALKRGAQSILEPHQQRPIQ